MARRWLVLGILAVAACASACASARHGDSDASGDDDDDDTDARPTTPDAAPDANNCTTQPCDILSQCGCDATHGCDIDGSDLMGNECRAVDSPGHETDTCASLEDCDRGYVCLGDGANNSCKKYCSASAECGTPRGQCVVDITDGTNPIPDVPSVCSSNCDPVNPSAGGCPAVGWKCGIGGTTHLGVDYDIAVCRVSGTGVQGTSCPAGNDALCAANFTCTTLDGSNFNCRKTCTIGGGQCGGLTCLQFNPPLTIGATEYGVCN